METTDKMGQEPELTFSGCCRQARTDIKKIGDTVRSLLSDETLGDKHGRTESYDGQHAETKANIMLAYRHLEDARMRVGKILQAAGDGVSILDT